MGKRREGREAAVQYLFFRDLNTGENAGTLDDFWTMRDGTAPTRKFTQLLTEGVIARRDEIDERIRGAVKNYELNRIAAVDRNILRLAIYEMFYCEDVPPIVAMNEAIEIAKAFGSDDSGRFVNGVLDRIAQDLPRSPRHARPSEAPGKH